MIIRDIYIGLGSNLHQPMMQVRTAINELKKLLHCECVAVSSLYQSAPMGSVEQADFINAVVHIRSGLSAEFLLDALQQLEAKHGRIRGQHWGPRSLDLDILLFGEQIIDSERLKIPHPGLYQRAFVLYPLYEIAPQLQLPDGRAIDVCCAALDAQSRQEISVLNE